MDYKWIINIILLIALHVGLVKLFMKAGRQAWEALIPGYNLVVADFISYSRCKRDDVSHHGVSAHQKF